MASVRRSVPAAAQAALWALSNGRCYYPDCSSPVVVEVRPGVYRKNAQMAHIHGVRRPRHDPALTPEKCAAFTNLLLMCLPHHSEVDDPKTGDRFYPPETLRRWKANHEGSHGPVLAALGSVEDSLTELLLSVFTPPVKRLQQIADQLEKTGTLNAQTVAQLREVVEAMKHAPEAPDMRAAALLADAAEIYGSRSFHTAASQLSHAAEVLGVHSLSNDAAQISEAAGMITSAARDMRRYGGEY